MTPITFNHNFTEKKLGLKQLLVTNSSARAWEYGEIVFAGGFIGEVREYDGIAAGASGYICIDPDRTFSTDQVNTTDVFTVGAVVVYFTPQSDTAAGAFRVATATGRVAFKAKIIGTGTSNAYIELKPPYQNGDLVAAT